MNIYAYHGYSQPMSGLAEDLQAAAAQFLQQAPAQASQAVAPVVQAAPVPVPAPAPVMASRDITPGAGDDKKVSWGPILIMLAILYFLMRKK